MDHVRYRLRTYRTYDCLKVTIRLATLVLASTSQVRDFGSDIQRDLHRMRWLATSAPILTSPYSVMKA